MLNDVFGVSLCLQGAMHFSDESSWSELFLRFHDGMLYNSKPLFHMAISVSCFV